MKSLKELITPQRPDDVGEVLIQWQIPEFTKHERSKKWYLAALIVVAALLIYSFVTVNFLFAVIVLLITFIAIFQNYQTPRKFDISITDKGVLVANQFYNYNELKAFWFIYNPPHTKNLYLDFNSWYKRDLSLPLEDVNPIMVREILQEFVVEHLEGQQEAFEEKFSRIIKF